MIRDASGIEPGSVLTTDVCVVGGGATGLVVAEVLAEAGCDVIVLERGGRHSARFEHAQNVIEDVGHPVGPIHRRRRLALGGAGRVWSGVSLELEDLDLHSRPGVVDASWPFGRDELDRHYASARQRLGIPARSDPRPRAPGIATVALHRSRVVFGTEDDPVPGATVIFGARCSSLIREGGRSGRVGVEATSAGGSRFFVRSREVVLAAGGIEAPRLLADSGIGNDRGLVGRYFSDHPYLTLRFEAPERTRPPEELTWDGHRIPPDRLVVRSEDARLDGHPLGAALFFRPARDPRIWDHPGVLALSEFAWFRRVGDLPPDPFSLARRAVRGIPSALRALRDLRGEPREWAARVVVEPVPDAESRVVLSERRGPSDEPIARVDWRIGTALRATLESFLADVSAMAESEGWGPLKFPERLGWPDLVEAGAHHMGATRMHRDPGRGVVDADLRVHGTENLFVVGPSVFTTYGYANSMLTSLALAMRLAEHLLRRRV